MADDEAESIYLAQCVTFNVPFMEKGRVWVDGNSHHSSSLVRIVIDGIPELCVVVPMEDAALISWAV